MILSLLLSLSVFAHGKARPVIIEPTPTPSAIVTPAPVLTGAMIQIGEITGASANEIAMIHEGARLANDMLSRKCFKQWVLAANYTENNGLSQSQIFAEVTTIPSKIDVEMYTGSWHANHVSRTVGYENDPFDGVVHMNRYFVDSAEMVGDNLIHEDRGHSLEFHHYGAHYTSEPYGMNLAYEGCSHVQEMQLSGGKAYKPRGLRIEVRKKKKK